MRALLFFVAEGWSSLRRNPAASLAAITALAAVLFVLILFLLLSRNVLVLAGRLEERKGLSIFLDSGLPPERVAELQQHFTGFREVKELRFVSRADALRDIEEDLGVTQIADALGANPLPDAFLITPRPEASDAATLERLAVEISAYEGVEDVLFGKRWVSALDQGLTMVRRANLITGGLAILAIVLVLANTLRLLVLMREEQLAVMKVIGATDPFLRAPFVTAGVGLCLVAALLSLLCAYAGFVATRAMMPGLRFLPASWVLAFLAGVGVAGVLGSLLTVEVSLHRLERQGGMARG